MLTTSVDRDWSDLAIKKAFLPLTRRVCGYLARSVGDERRTKAVVGEPHRLDLDGFRPQRVIVRSGEGASPSDGLGQPVVFGQQDLTLEASPSVRVKQPGVYRVDVVEGGREIAADGLAFAAGVDVRESETRRLGRTSLEASLAPAADVAEGASGVAGARSRGVPLWPMLLIAGLLALYLETLIGLRRSFWTRFRRRAP